MRWRSNSRKRPASRTAWGPWWSSGWQTLNGSSKKHLDPLGLKTDVVPGSGLPRGLVRCGEPECGLQPAREVAYVERINEDARLRSHEFRGAPDAGRHDGLARRHGLEDRLAERL